MCVYVIPVLAFTIITVVFSPKNFWESMVHELVVDRNYVDSYMQLLLVDAYVSDK